MDLTIVAPEVSAEGSAFLERTGVAFERAEAPSRARGDFTLVSEVPVSDRALDALWRRRQEAEAVVASRYVRGAHGGSLPSRWVNRLARRLIDLPCFDLTSGVHLYRTSALRRALQDGETVGPTETLVRLVNAGFKIKEVAWDGPVAEEGLAAHLLEAWRLRRVRRAPGAADADDRAYDRAGRFHRRALAERQATIVGFLEVDVPVLDVGCGSSRLVQLLSKGVGLDRDAAKIRFLRGRARSAVCGDIARLPFRDGSFPQVVLADVPAGDGHLPEIKRVLGRNGTLVVAAPVEASTEIDQRLVKEGFSLDETRRVGRERIVRAVVRPR